MVQIDVEQWEAVRKARKDEADELTETEKQLLGRNVRLELPIYDLAGMKEAADMLIGLGHQIKFIAEQRGVRKADKLFAIRSHTHSVRDRLRVVNGRKDRKYDKV